MATAPRKRSEGDIYHLIVRGVGKQIVFEDDLDRQRYMSGLDRAAEALGIEIWAWCLMSNHVHLLAKAPIEAITQFMRRTQSGYAIYFNRRHGRSGKLFQGRFASIPIESDEQLMTTVRYIHLNPVDAGGSISSPWSSYDVLAAGGRDIKGSAFVLGVFGGVGPFKTFHSATSDASLPDLPHWRLSEDDALRLARETVAPLSLYDIKALPKNERDSKLVLLRNAGLSVRQIARCTGIGHNIVARAK